MNDNNSPIDPVSTPVSPRKDKAAKRRKEKFLSLWLVDETLKTRLQFVAESEKRSMSNYFNQYLAPVIEKQIAERQKALTSAH